MSGAGLVQRLLISGLLLHVLKRWDLYACAMDCVRKRVSTRGQCVEPLTLMCTALRCGGHAGVSSWQVCCLAIQHHLPVLPSRQLQLLLGRTHL
jgi:hypothetical protein